MKRLFVTAALGVVCVSGFAQGTLNFANGAPGVVARVYYTDGVTGLSGSAWSADLYWASGTVANPALLNPLNQPATFSTIAAQAGLFMGGPRTIPGAAGSSVITAQVRVWDTASGGTWASASANPNSLLGESMLFQVTLGDPNATPPGIPASMTALNNHPWQVGIPEPSTLALAGLGVVVFLRRCLTPIKPARSIAKSLPSGNCSFPCSRPKSGNSGLVFS
jgi:hypothetical protein